MADHELEPIPRADLRVSHADREATASQLQAAVADGRLGLDELDERLEAAYAAKTYRDLAVVTRDLAPAVSDLPPAHGSRQPVLELSALMSDVRRDGPWHAPARITATAGMGSIKLDFSEAVLEADQIHVVANANAGSVLLLVPEGWRVDLDRVTSGMGSVRNKAVAPRPGLPTLIVSGRAALGDVTVRHPRAVRWLPR